MSNVLIIQIRGASPDDLNAPLTVKELGQIESFIAKVKAGEEKATDDPEQRDLWRAQKPVGVEAFRKEEAIS